MVLTGYALHIKDQSIAETDIERAGNLFLKRHGHCGVGALDAALPGASDERFRLKQVLPIGGTVFPQQGPLWNRIVLLIAQLHGASPLDGLQAHGHERDLLQHGEPMGAHQARHVIALIALNIEQDHVRLPGGIGKRDVTQQRLLGQIECREQKCP